MFDFNDEELPYGTDRIIDRVNQYSHYIDPGFAEDMFDADIYAYLEGKAPQPLLVRKARFIDFSQNMQLGKILRQAVKIVMAPVQQNIEDMVLVKGCYMAVSDQQRHLRQ